MRTGSAGGIQVATRQPAQRKSRRWWYGELRGQAVPTDACLPGVRRCCAYWAEHHKITAKLRGVREFGA